MRSGLPTTVLVIAGTAARAAYRSHRGELTQVRAVREVTSAAALAGAGGLLGAAAGSTVGTMAGATIPVPGATILSRAVGGFLGGYLGVRAGRAGWPNACSRRARSAPYRSSFVGPVRRPGVVPTCSGGERMREGKVDGGARGPDAASWDRAGRIERQLATAQQITHIGSWEWDVATNATPEEIRSGLRPPESTEDHARELAFPESTCSQK